MMTDYTRIIEDIIPKHNTKVSLEDTEGHLVLDGITRIITPAEGFSTLIGTTDDVNTNIVTFDIPETIEGHKIVECGRHIVKWHNIASGDKGTSDLIRLDAETPTMWQWIVPAEALTAAGAVKISLCFYDTDGSQNIVYRWNSLPYNGLTVGQGMDEIGTDIVPLDEIIMLDLRTRKISVPDALNKELGKEGESALTTLRFRCDRYYQDIDFGDNARVTIFWRNSNKEGTFCTDTEDISIRLIQTYSGTGELIEFDWSVSQALVNAGAGDISFSVSLIKATGDDKFIVWYSDTCEEFYIGSTITSGDLPEADEGAELYIVDGQKLDTELSNILGDDGQSQTGPMSVSEAIAYSLNRFMDAGVTIDSGDASQYIEE